MKLRIAAVALAAAFALAVPRAARAGIIQGQINVSLTAIDGCTALTANNLSFPTFTFAAVSATTTIDVTCSEGVNFAIDAGNGQHFMNTDRRLGDASNQNFLIYNLYVDSAHTQVFGQGLGGVAIHDTGTGASQSFTIYGLTSAGNLPAGSYTDAVDVFLQF